MAKGEPKKLLARVEPELHHRLKVYAAKSGRTMAEVAAIATDQYLTRVEGRGDG